MACCTVELKKLVGETFAKDYLPLLVTYTKEDAEINGLRKAKATDTVDREAEYFSGVEALSRSKRIVLVGEKGMGKTSFLRMTALCMDGEAKGDGVYNLSKLCEPVVRSRVATEGEAQLWDGGLLKTALYDLRELNGGHFPAEAAEAELILLDGLEAVDAELWQTVCAEINGLCAKNEKLYFAVTCEADVLNRLRPRLNGFTTYTVKSLLAPQRRGLAADYADRKVSESLAEVLEVNQNFILWAKSACKAETLAQFCEALAAEAGLDDPYKRGFEVLCGRAEPMRPEINSLATWLACNYCIKNDFGPCFAELIHAMGYEAWGAIRMLKRIMREGDGASFAPAIRALCPEGEPVEEKALLALYSAELMFEIRDLVSDDSTLSLLQKWMKAIVTNGWLAAYDRVAAGKRLSWLGDDRDLDAMLDVPAGDFTMGDTLIANNQPVTTVHVDAFKIGKYPIVNRIYGEFIQETGHAWLSSEGNDVERRNYPAINLTWEDAVDFCDWLTEKWRKSGRINANEYVRLSTEAEWEYAARGKHECREGEMIFAWGREWHDDYANTAELGLNDTCTVGLFPMAASDFGCMDMNGMIWEWNTTNWGSDPKKPMYPYPYNANDGREESRHAPSEIRRCMRGGSFGSTADHATATYRGHLESIGFWRGDGFRIVISEKAHE